MVTPFAIVPVEIAMDDRLTKMQLRVLLAILTFRNKDTNLCHPTREQIGQRCGYTKEVVSRVTTQLVDLGWLEKTGKGGFSKSSEYKFKVPETVTGEDTVSEVVTVTKPETVTTSDNNSNQAGQTTVTEPVTGKRQTNNRPVTDHRHRKMAQAMFARIVDKFPKTKAPNLDKWATDIRLMIDRDKRTPEEIWHTFVWANDHDFWSANILSPGTLRKQFDKLAAQKSRPERKDPARPKQKSIDEVSL